jgi:hypothetical protein
MVILVFLMLWVSAAGATILHVPSEYPSVQQGLNTAGEHDTVLVAEGTYYENLKFPSCNLVLASLFLLDGDSVHVANTILDGSQPIQPDSASVLFLAGAQDSTTLITGFTIQGGQGTTNLTWYPGYSVQGGGGCVILTASPTLKFNKICANTADLGGGLYLGLLANPIISNNEIYQNYATSYAGGILGNNCSAIISDNHIHHNVSANWEGGSYFFNCEQLIFESNTVDYNQAPMFSGGLFAHGNFIVTGNVIRDHTNLYPYNPGAGLSFGAGDPITNVTLTNNQFLRNVGAYSSALSMQSTVNALITNNLFQDNSAWVGAALDLWDGTYTIRDNRFIDNTDSSGGGVVNVGLNAFVTMEGNTITGSVGLPIRGSAIDAYLNASIDIHNNNIYGNSSPAVALSELSAYPTINALNNWWGDPSGPYHPLLNPAGLGNAVGDHVLFDPWLTSLVGVQPSSPSERPEDFDFSPPYPNPFNPSTVASFELPVAGHVSLKVYDTAGRLVSTLVNGWRDAGEHRATFDGSGLPSGVYLARLEAGEFTQTQKLVLLK